MDSKPSYITGYAIIRVDGDQVDHPSRLREFQKDGEVLPAAGPANIKVLKVIMSAEEARHEVIRLNQLNESIGCYYYWQATQIFLDET
jgi:hypothetical protein